MRNDLLFRGNVFNKDEIEAIKQLCWEADLRKTLNGYLNVKGATIYHNPFNYGRLSAPYKKIISLGYGFEDPNAQWSVIDYKVGDYTNPHPDVATYTTITLLNQNFEGGEYVLNGQSLKIKKGETIIHRGEIPHSVTEIIKGHRMTLLGWSNKEE